LCFLNIYPQKKTLNVRGAKTVWVRCGGASKERATVMLLGDSNGVRYTPFVIFKMKPSKIAAKDNETKRCGFSTRTWPENKQIQRDTGLQIYTNGK
ncbi:hypothetical protein JG687_00009135, partial [Phytophthora cactorum]